jgi:hypothetical protein
MVYRIQVGNQQMTISVVQFDELRDAMQNHVQDGFRDGETRLGSVVIPECGAKA